ncbi:MAG: class II aldolase/adducin family protein [Deltaproteobacteria bacterium]|nr:class II aldolase/adducin family protein [Deltaproteobacteria bacterium]
MASGERGGHQSREGVIKFAATHQSGPLPRAATDLVGLLAGWRRILFDLGLLGRDGARYQGAAYGNLSARVGPFPGERGARAFAITGTQTSDRRDLGPEDFCVVSAADVKRNHVTSHGPSLPSSESMTHATVYDASPTIRAVFHVHAPAIFEARLGLPETAPDVDYGTPEMAREVARLWRSTALADARVFVMRGHHDGVVAFGKSIDDAGGALIAALARAGERRR